MEYVEKRQFVRHPFVTPLEFRILGKKKAEMSEMVNISVGGLMFMSRREVSSGTMIELLIPLYDKTFKVKAKVMHSTKDDTTGFYKTGVSFVSYADAFKMKLIEQIYLIEEYRTFRSLQLGEEVSLKEASREWLQKCSERLEKLHW